MKLSTCCGAAPRTFNDDCDSEDIGICPSCGDHCDFVTEDEMRLQYEKFGPDKHREG